MVLRGAGGMKRRPHSRLFRHLVTVESLRSVEQTAAVPVDVLVGAPLPAHVGYLAVVTGSTSYRNFGLETVKNSSLKTIFPCFLNCRRLPPFHQLAYTLDPMKSNISQNSMTTFKIFFGHHDISNWP